MVRSLLYMGAGIETNYFKSGATGMAVFRDIAVMQELFGEMWTRMIHETEFGKELRKNDLSIVFITEDPDAVMYVDGEGPLFGEEAKARTPAVTMRMSGDTVHRFWLEQVDVPNALVLREIRARGQVAKILQIIPLLKQGFAIYQEYCEKYNLPTC